MSIIFVDLEMTVPLYLLSAAVLTYKQWQLVRFSKITPELVFSTVFSHIAALTVDVAVVYGMQSCIAARLDSDDTSSLLLAFRQVLRGVCDGELVLDRRNQRIVDDASSLQRLLNTVSKKDKKKLE